MAKKITFKQTNITITITAVVSFLLLLGSGIYLYNNEISLLDTTMKWIFAVSMATLATSGIVWTVTKLLKALKIKVKK